MSDGADAALHGLAGQSLSGIADVGTQSRPSTLRRWSARPQMSWELTAGAAILLAATLAALLAPMLTAIDPRALAIGARLAPPGPAHPFGTDALGRDLFSRVLYGGRVSIGIGVVAALASSMLGTAVGVISPVNRLVDGVIMRVMDGVMSIPAILLAIAMVAVTGASVQNVILAVTVVEAPRIARVVRAEVLSLRERPYVEAAIVAGAPTWRILWRHYLPGVLPQLTVQATFVWASAMLIESALSFIGAGTPPITPSWGNIMADGKALWQIKPNLVFIPAAFLSATLFAVNLLAEGLRKRLSPHMSRRR